MAHGQIVRMSPFGEAIYGIACNQKFQTYLDIGAWCGLGTTKCMMDGIILRHNHNPADKSMLIALETKRTFYNITKTYWEKHIQSIKLPQTIFQIHNASLVSYNELDEKINNCSKEQYEYNKDIKLCPVVDLCNNVDVVCLDGGLFSTRKEWEKLKNRIQVVILDDTRFPKTSTILQEIKNQPQTWNIIYESNLRNGELIAERKTCPI